MTSGVAAESHSSENADDISSLSIKKRVERFQNDGRVQMFWSSIIVLNFAVFVVEEQWDAVGTTYPEVWQLLGTVFTFLFTVELVLNLTAFCFWRFVKNPWYLFDIFIVITGIYSSISDTVGLPKYSALEQLRVVRTFRVLRVLRLLYKFQSLQTIIMSILQAMPGVLNLFVITVLFISIYALIAVDLFRGVGCPPSDSILTARGDCIGSEYFGTFARAFFTLFQVLTGDSWAEGVARPLLWTFEDSSPSAVFTAAYFTSFQVLSAMVLINVVVAVLTAKLQEQEEEAAQAAFARQSSPGACSEADLSANLPAEEEPSKLERRIGEEHSLEQHFQQLSTKLLELFSQHAKSLEQTVNGKFLECSKSLDEKIRQFEVDMRFAKGWEHEATMPAGADSTPRVPPPLQMSDYDSDVLAVKVTACKSQDMEERLVHLEDKITTGLQALAQESSMQRLHRTEFDVSLLEKLNNILRLQSSSAQAALQPSRTLHGSANEAGVMPLAPMPLQSLDDEAFGRASPPISKSSLRAEL